MAGGLLGFLAWSGVECGSCARAVDAGTLGLAPNRIAAGLCAFGYYAAASHGVPVGAEVFFQNGLVYAVILAGRFCTERVAMVPAVRAPSACAARRWRWSSLRFRR